MSKDDAAPPSGKLGIDALPLPTAPDTTPDPSPKALSKIVPWYDGFGGEKRLKIRGVRELPEPTLPERGPDAADPGDVDELHREVKKAFLEEDDRKLGKLFEDILDPLHNSDSRSHQKTDEERADEATADFEAALTAELKRFTEQVRGWGASYKLSTNDKARALVIRLKSPKPYSATHDVEFDEKMLERWLRRRKYNGAQTGLDMAEHAIKAVRSQLLISR